VGQTTNSVLYSTAAHAEAGTDHITVVTMTKKQKTKRTKCTTKFNVLYGQDRHTLSGVLSDTLRCYNCLCYCQTHQMLKLSVLCNTVSLSQPKALTGWRSYCRYLLMGSGIHSRCSTLSLLSSRRIAMRQSCCSDATLIGDSKKDMSPDDVL